MKSIFETGAEALVNPVNIVGVMGAGLAKQFKIRYPDNFKCYQYECFGKRMKMGHVFTYKTDIQNPKYIINFPTKRHWKEQSKVEYISSGLFSLIKGIEDNRIQSIAIPALGCGLGGLNWNDVKPLILKAFEQLPNVELFLFNPTN